MIKSNFSKGREGWTAFTVINFDNYTQEQVDYNRKFDYISVGSGGGSQFFKGGFEWTGDLSGHFSDDLSFRLRQDGHNEYFSRVQVQIYDSEGNRISVRLPQPDDQDWHSYAVSLDQFGGWWSGTGDLATEDTIRAVLSDVDRILIQGGSRYSDIHTDLDDVVLSAKPATSRVAYVGNDQVVSDFNAGGENWSFLNDVKSFKHSKTDGVTGGYLKAVDSVSGLTMYFAAPDEFEGEKGGFFGGTFSFFMKAEGTGFSSSISRSVVIRGANDTYITWAMEAAPGEDWTRYQAHLDETGGWEFGLGVRATDDQIKAILDDILSIEIRGEFIYGPETVGLDNVKLTAPDGRFDILAEEHSARLLATTDRFKKAIELLNDGNFLDIAAGEPLDKTLLLSTDDVTIQAGGALSGSITLDDSVRALHISGAGKTLEVAGNALSNSLRASGPDSKFIELSGKGGDDFLFGSANPKGGTARLIGGSGDDTLLGGFSGDKLIGGNGNDRLEGQGRHDRLLGGKGADTFVFDSHDGRDLIVDFGKGHDRIELLRTGMTGFDDLTFGTWHGNLAIELGGNNMIVLDGYSNPSELSADDFLFVA